MGAALFKRGWGCQIELPPRTTAPRGRLPLGRWRSRTASGRRGWGGRGRGRVASVSVYMCARARCLLLKEAFSIKINSGGWPRLRAPLRAPLFAWTVLISLPNRRVPPMSPHHRSHLSGPLPLPLHPPPLHLPFPGTHLCYLTCYLERC